MKNKTLLAVFAGIVIAIIVLALYRYGSVKKLEIVSGDMIEYSDPRLNFKILIPKAVDSAIQYKGKTTSSIFVISNLSENTAYFVAASENPIWINQENLGLDTLQEYEADIRARIKFYDISSEEDVETAIRDYYLKSNFTFDSYKEAESELEIPFGYRAYFLDEETNEKIDIGAIFAMKYSADKKRIALWGLGHDMQFVLTKPAGGGRKQFDNEMIKSMEVLEL